MKTCYGGYCIEHRDFSEIAPSAGMVLVVVGAIAVTLFLVTLLSNGIFLDTPLTNINDMNFIPY